MVVGLCPHNGGQDCHYGLMLSGRQSLSKMHDQRSVMLCWRSSLEWGNEHVACHFASKAGQ